MDLPNCMRCFAYATVISSVCCAPPSISAHLPTAPHANAFLIVSHPPFNSPSSADPGTCTLSRINSDCLSDAIVSSGDCVSPSVLEGTTNRLMSESPAQF